MIHYYMSITPQAPTPCAPLLRDRPDDNMNWVPTNLGKATLASGMAPEHALLVKIDLEHARDMFIMATELHLTYLVTPINAEINVSWDMYVGTGGHGVVGHICGHWGRCRGTCMWAQGPVSWDMLAGTLPRRSFGAGCGKVRGGRGWEGHVCVHHGACL